MKRTIKIILLLIVMVIFVIFCYSHITSNRISDKKDAAVKNTELFSVQYDDLIEYFNQCGFITEEIVDNISRSVTINAKKKMNS